MFRFALGAILLALIGALGSCFNPTFTKDQPFTCRSDDWCPDDFSCVPITGGKVCRRDCESSADCVEQSSTCQDGVCVPGQSTADGSTGNDGAAPRQDSGVSSLVCSEPEYVADALDGSRSFDLVVQPDGQAAVVSINTSGVLEVRRRAGTGLGGESAGWELDRSINPPGTHQLVAAAFDGGGGLHMVSYAFAQECSESVCKDMPALGYCRPVGTGISCDLVTSQLSGAAGLGTIFDLDLDAADDRVWLAVSWLPSVNTGSGYLTVLRRSAGNAGNTGFERVCGNQDFSLANDGFMPPQALRLAALDRLSAVLSAWRKSAGDSYWTVGRYSSSDPVPVTCELGLFSQVMLPGSAPTNPTPAAVLSNPPAIDVLFTDPQSATIRHRLIDDTGPSGIKPRPSDAVVLEQAGLDPAGLALANWQGKSLALMLAEPQRVDASPVVVAVRDGSRWDLLPLQSNNKAVKFDGRSVVKMAIDKMNVLHLAYDSPIDGPVAEPGYTSRVLRYLSCPLGAAASKL